ncbi:MAG: hypothetical protein LBB20_03580 [Puniceicoccales bacterium]|jgi:hypothetical protein|nr:hypothetical protein [Puniceicoccales bacterium]
MVPADRLNWLINELSDMVLKTSKENLVVPEGMSSATDFMLSMYSDAIKMFAADETCSVIINKLIDFAKEDKISMALTKISEPDVSVLENFAENATTEDQVKLWQLLTLVIPDGNPNAYAYMMLAENVADTNLEAGTKMYDFLLTLFPHHPLILMNAAECFFDAEQPEKAVKSLTHAKELCEKEPSNNIFQELLPEINTLLNAITEE